MQRASRTHGERDAGNETTAANWHNNGVDVWTLLENLETETVIGAYKVDVHGAQLAASTLLVQIQKGRREVILPEAYRSAEAVLSPPPWSKPR